jgi:hypothetical protein
MSKAKCPKNGLFGKCSPFFGKGAMPATFGRAVLVSWLCLRPSSKELRRSSMYSLLLVHTLRSSGTSKGASLITFVGAALTRSFLGYNNEPPARSNRSTWKKVRLITVHLPAGVYNRTSSPPPKPARLQWVLYL